MTYAAFLSAPQTALRSLSLATTRSRLELGVDSSSFVEASAATTSLVNSLANDISVPTSKEFEPILPDASALLGIAAVLIESAAAGWVWANQVVPVSRTKLALSKRQGDVKDYLEALEQAEDERQLEQWLFTDWLEQRKARGPGNTPGRQKEPALPVLKNAKWNSGDNPILAATALILVGVTFGAIVEQASL